MRVWGKRFAGRGLISDRLSKKPNFPSQSLTVENPSKRPPPVSDHDHFLGLKVTDRFSIVFKPPIDAFCDLYVRCVHCTTLNTAISGKVIGKRARDNPEGYCG